MALYYTLVTTAYMLVWERGCSIHSATANNGIPSRISVIVRSCFVQEIRRITAACRRPYLVFVTIQASLLVKKANEILSTTRKEYRRQQAAFL